MGEPLVSIITVCRNANQALRQTANSVLALKDCHVEYIVVDGASTDETVDTLHQIEVECAERGITMRWVSEPDKGIYDAMNKGCRMARGHWLNFMKAGDTFASPEAISQMGLEDTSHETGIVYGNVNKVMAFGTIETRPAPLSLLERKMALCHQAAFVRSALLADHPYDLRYPVAADYEFFYWAYKSGHRFRWVDIVVANFESEGGFSQQNRLRMNREFARINGRSHTLRWKISYVLKYIEMSMNRLYRWFMPKSVLNALRQRNYERKARKMLLCR